MNRRSVLRGTYTTDYRVADPLRRRLSAIWRRLVAGWIRRRVVHYYGSTTGVCREGLSSWGCQRYLPQRGSMGTRMPCSPSLFRRPRHEPQPMFDPLSRVCRHSRSSWARTSYSPLLVRLYPRSRTRNQLTEKNRLPSHYSLYRSTPALQASAYACCFFRVCR